MNDTFMKEKPVFPLIMSMALPMVISMLVNSLYNIVDSFFVAQISENAMTALSLVFPVQNFANAIAIGFGIGISSQIAICLGAGNRETASKAATHGLALSGLHGVILTIGCILVMPGFLALFTGDTDVIDLGIRYSTIVFLFATINTLNLAYEKIFQGVGKMKITMIGLLVGCVSNIILDPLLIFGLGPFPALGIEGAALCRHPRCTESCAAFCPGFCTERTPGSLLTELCRDPWNLLQTTDIPVSSGKWNRTGNASGHWL